MIVTNSIVLFPILQFVLKTQIVVVSVLSNSTCTAFVTLQCFKIAKLYCPLFIQVLKFSQ